MSACDSCPSKSGCTSQSTCPSANGGAAKPSAPQKEAQNANSNIKTVIGVASGKGGVGKSFVTTMLAIELSRKGYKVGIMDADITGPSIPQAFGLKGKMAESDETTIYPALSKHGIKIMSANLLMPDDESPIIWRGPMIAGFVQQLYTDVTYGDVDYMFIDMPPGTGDVPLTIFQMYPIDGIIIVTTPQDLVSMVVKKSINMAKMMYINTLGIVENMAYIKCPKCDEKIRIFGSEESKKEIEKSGIKVLAELPIDPLLSQLVDKGEIEEYETDALNPLLEIFERGK